MAANVQSFIQYWKNFDLPQLQRELDVTATELANRQDESDSSRRRLVDFSRDFKRNTPEDIRKAVVPLLKSFQAEVDSLSKRSKAAEAAFLTVYRAFTEVPDPVPALEHYHVLLQRTMRVQELEIENRHLRKAISDYNQEFKVLQNQEVTIKVHPENFRKLEEKEESAVPEREEGREILRLLAEKENNRHETRIVVKTNLEEAETKVAQLQSALDRTQSQLLDLKSKYDEDSDAKSDEIETIVNDLERANQRAALAEKEVYHLKDQLAAAKQSLQLADQIQKAPDMEQAVDVVARSSLELELVAKEKEISQLVDDIQRLQTILNTLKETSASKIAQLEELVNEKDRMIVELGDKLVRQRDYDEIKKELTIMKTVECAKSLLWENKEGSKKSNDQHVDLLPKDNNKSLNLESLSLKNDKPDDTSRILNCSSSHRSGDRGSEQEALNFSQHGVKEEDCSRPSTPVKATPEPCADSEDRKPLTFHLDHHPSHQASSPTAAHHHRPVESSPPQVCSPAAVNLSHGGERTSPHHPQLPSPGDNPSLGRLQECLRHNIDRYANETLNTLNIARCVRELLSVHNIGQRLFAKFVLGLSQGTVSELLSKPKPWDKLTEKGRDSYRKMHAWASDEHCISMLKSLVPRRGKDCVGGGGAGLSCYKPDDQGAEERIAQILNEAQMAMMKQQEQKSPSALTPNGTDNRSTDSGDDHDAKSHSNSSTREATSNEKSFRRSRKYENDDIPQEMVARIYQEELAKLIGQRVEEGFRTPRDQFERTQEEIRQALTIYHQELTRLSHLMPANHQNSFGAFAAANGEGTAHHHHHHHSNNNNGTPNSNNSSSNHYHHHHHEESPVDATLSVRSRSDLKTSRTEEQPELRHHGSAFSLVRPKTEPTNLSGGNNNSKSGAASAAFQMHNHSPALSRKTPSPVAPPQAQQGGEDLSTSASPLQRIQSITNSLLSQSSLPSLPNPPQRPAKAVLPPITQQQFDQYNSVNTEDIVKKVKEQLSQYSISQRLFGESVLGLSQGSVSDLLARPKPWHMLTQKGREPFIRMKIFLEDENAVHKLVASQYKIAPEKLMRTGSFGGATNPTGIMTFGSSKLSSRPPETNNHRTSENRQLVNNNNNNINNNALYVSSHPAPPRSLCGTPDSQPISLTTSAPSTLAPNRKSSTGTVRGYGQPSVYEMAALTTDLDTQIITSKIKETLMAHNIGQKIFGEVVLGLSQGSVSELLSKPKPWHMLSIKGREPFIRMQMWLNDAHNVDMLQSIKNERREANKRRRTGEGPMDSPRSQSDSQMYNYSFAPPSPYPPAKKPRVLFTEEQKEALRLAFSLDPYPSTATIEFLGSELTLSIRTITNWFHNHRMRMKQQSSPDDDHRRLSDPVPPPPVREGLAFDPVHYRMLLSQRLAEKSQRPAVFGGHFGGYLYSPFRNCSPLSSSGEEAGTLDLSMSRHKMDSNSSTDDRSNSEINEEDDSNLSQDNDHESLEDNSNQHPLRGPAPPSTNHVRPSNGSSSNRRKPAMPQWVDPAGLDLSPDSDVHTDEDEDDLEDDQQEEQIINGVCVRQTEDFDHLLLPRVETVLPTAPSSDAKNGSFKDGAASDYSDNEPPVVNGDDRDTPSGRKSREDDMCASPKKSIAFTEEQDDESWDDAEAKDRRKNIEKLQQRLEKEESEEDWEF